MSESEEFTLTPPSRLRGKRATFVEHYLGRACGNATEAARLCRFASPAVAGHRLLREPEVRGEIDRKLAENSITQEEVLSRLSAYARGVHGAYYYVDNAGMLQLDFEKLLADGHGHCIRKVSYTPTSHQVEFIDPLKALAMCARLLGMTQPQESVTGEDVSIGEALDRKLARIAAAAGAE